MSIGIESLVNDKIVIIKDAYIKDYRSLIPDAEHPTKEVIDALAARLIARMGKSTNPEMLADAVNEEFDLLTLLKTNPRKLKHKHKSSLFARGVKKTLTVLSDNDMSGFSARHEPVGHTAMDVGTMAPVDTAIEHVATNYASVGVQGINFLSVPFLYIYYYARGEPVPFTLKNNTKFTLSAIALALGVVALTVPPAAIFIAFVSSAIGLAISVYALGKFIYERATIQRHINSTNDRIKELIGKINISKENIQHTRINIITELKNPKPNMELISKLTNELNGFYHTLETDQQNLKERIKDRHALQHDKSAGKTVFLALSSTMRVMLACTVITGLALTLIPFTAPIGATMLTVALVSGLALFAVTKIHHSRMTSKEKAAAKQDKDYLHNVLDKNEEPALSSTLKYAAPLETDLTQRVTHEEVQPLLGETNTYVEPYPAKSSSQGHEDQPVHITSNGNPSNK